MCTVESRGYKQLRVFCLSVRGALRCTWEFRRVQGRESDKVALDAVLSDSESGALCWRPPIHVQAPTNIQALT